MKLVTKQLVTALALFVFTFLGPPVSGESQPAATEEIMIIKTRIMFRPNTITSYKGEYNNIWSWVPTVTFDTEGALPSGAHLYVEVAQPGGAPWMKIKCDGAGQGVECKADSDAEKNSTLVTGVFPFVIKLRNPLEGSEQTLFTGKAKVEKALANEVGPTSVRKFVYFPNLDWNLPIGHVLIDDRDFLNVRFWIRGEATNTIDAHLFYRGEEVGLFEKYGNQYGASRCSSDIDYQPTRDAGATGSDGKIVDNRIAANNGMGSSFIIVPVQISGEQDGPWDKMAWKTDAFFGNPLTGFNWPPQ